MASYWRSARIEGERCPQASRPRTFKPGANATNARSQKRLGRLEPQRHRAATTSAPTTSLEPRRMQEQVILALDAGHTKEPLQNAQEGPSVCKH
jgi:hypothetical protein